MSDVQSWRFHANCPRCGRVRVLVVTYHPGSATIRCDTCGARGPLTHSGPETFTQAIQAALRKPSP